MKTSEIRQLSLSELQERIADEQDRYKQMALNHSVTPLENPATLKLQRRTIAKMKTVLREALANK